ncbi:MAG: hypothetical protein M3R37_07295 [Actinomycetota bacterium]|nr:hypothetical protein [Actinomycetota bacterium]
MMFAVAVTVAALGLVAHNLLSLPLPLFSPETLGPFVVYIGLLGWYRLSRAATAARATFLLWTAANFVIGALLTALPLPILPFVPDQTLGHYLAHAIYALTQVPLLWLLIRPTRTLAAA